MLFAPPMLSEIVGGGAGASIGSGRCMGCGSGCEDCWGTRPFPGTNSKAPGLSLLISEGDRGQCLQVLAWA